ncbi:HD-GYP domain-containing protein [Virgibacillus ndiopensis]|uniref:HD-GYP domain-containing protein n=1 Tax=Virgibacillus ndiopensis TaxID=2004408 RepID=UPI000C08130A|nr:HD-GYP domain-containing protein [Virgibacillus ndiopensis]
MQKRIQTSLLNEEKRTTIWFLWLFYTIYLAYDITYYYILPEFSWESGQDILSMGITFWMYIVMFGLLPFSFHLIKKKKIWLIKYIYFITYTSLNIINDIWIYWDSNVSYSSGNVVELVIVMFSPIFVNKKFFTLVSYGTILKFIVIGLVLRDTVVLFPLLIIVVLSMIGYIFLHRFLNYIDAVKQSYDKQLEGIVKGIIATLELKDPYTRGHSERVAQYAMILAKATGRLKEEKLKSFYYTCLLHDIGKIHIPDSILTKPGRLTKDEFDVVKTHPDVGAKAVQQVVGIADNINVIRHHHERWDGNGYPDQIGGENIDFLARITAIADAFDAMTSSRSYRSALPLDEAYKRIIKEMGTQFDPNLEDKFKKVYPIWIDYHKTYYAQNKSIDKTAALKRG